VGGGSWCEWPPSGIPGTASAARQHVECELLTDPEGHPVAVEGLVGSTADRWRSSPSSAGSWSGIGDDHRDADGGPAALRGHGWIIALRAPAVAGLARDGGLLQMSMSGEPSLAEITVGTIPASG
jgi:hypothetical protein